MDENKLIQGLREGDSGAFRDLVEKYQLPVMNTCLGFVRNRHDAEDTAQEVFLEIFRSIHGFRSDAKLSTWIYRIAVNKSLNFLRRKKRQRWLSPLEELLTGKKDTPSFREESAMPSDDMEKVQRMKHIHAAIAALPENQRIAFSLNKNEELSYQEISEVMNLSLSSVESLIHRAKVNLQKKLWDCYKKECL